MYLFLQFLTFVFFLSSAFIQETKREEIIVTATQIEEPKQDVPYSVQVITERF